VEESSLPVSQKELLALSLAELIAMLLAELSPTDKAVGESLSPADNAVRESLVQVITKLSRWK
jgi:hypothetical protein